VASVPNTTLIWTLTLIWGRLSFSCAAVCVPWLCVSIHSIPVFYSISIALEPPFAVGQARRPNDERSHSGYGGAYQGGVISLLHPTSPTQSLSGISWTRNQNFAAPFVCLLSVACCLSLLPAALPVNFCKSR